MITYCQFHPQDFMFSLFLLEYTEAKESHWQIHYTPITKNIDKEHNELLRWLNDNCIAGYNFARRDGGGSPYFAISILDKSDLTAFKLRWDNSL
jgi:hypothetical protein